MSEAIKHCHTWCRNDWVFGCDVSPA